MKKLLFIVITCSFSSYLSAQSSVLDIKGYCVTATFGPGTLQGYYELIDQVGNTSEFYGLFESEPVFIREDGRKMYVRSDSEPVERLACDFSLIPGDTFTASYLAHGDFPYLVVDTGTIPYPEGDRFAIDLLRLGGAVPDADGYILGQTMKWLEGIGSIFGPNYLERPGGLFDTLGGSGLGMKLECATDADFELAYSVSGLYCEEDSLNICNAIYNGIDETLLSAEVLSYVTSGHLFLSWESDLRFSNVELWSMAGQLMGTKRPEASWVSIPVNHLSTGIYMAVLLHEDGWRKSIRFTLAQ